MQSLERLSARRVPINDSVSGKAFKNIDFPKEIIGMIKEGITFERLIKENLMNQKSNPLYFYEALNNVSKTLPWKFLDEEISPDYNFIQNHELKNEESLEVIANKMRGTRKQAADRMAEAIKYIKKFVLLIFNNPGLLIGYDSTLDYQGNNGDFNFAWDIKDDQYRLLPLFYDNDINEDGLSHKNIDIDIYDTFDNLIGSVIESGEDYLYSIDNFKVYPVEFLPARVRKGFDSLNDGTQYLYEEELNFFQEKLREELIDDGSILLITKDIYFGSPILKNMTQVVNIGENLLFVQVGDNNIKNMSMYSYLTGLWIINTTYPFNDKSSYVFNN